jgi:hypothetical protein
MTTRYLTKSRFKLAVSCPTKLFYTGKSNYANTNDENEFLAMLADGGYQVGELAKLMYPTGIEIKAKDSEVALTQTAGYLSQENVVLFEPAISYGQFLVRVDVLIKRGNVLLVIEVKAKSYSGDLASLSGRRTAIKTEILPYIQDVAFQKYVVQLAFPGSTVSASLLMPDKSKRATVNGMNQWFKVRRNGKSTEVLTDPHAKQPGLAETVLTCVNVDHLVSEVISNDIDIPGGKDSLAHLAAVWADAYQRDVRIPPVIGAHCGSCEYKAAHGSKLASGFHECWKYSNQWTDTDFMNGTVLDLWNFVGKDKLIQAGVVKLSQVTEIHLKLTTEKLGPLTNQQRQWLQVKGLPEDCKMDGYYLDRDGLANEMQGWKYPLHMIDFETASVALPFHKGRRPYEQVAFQFSHHVIDKDGKVRHADEFLNAVPGEFPNYAFVRALYEALRHDQGTIMRWSHHENSILIAIKEQLKCDENPPADTVALLAFIERITNGGERAMVDLADIARKYYFHPVTKGSCSIKKVLPAVMQSSPFLKSTYSLPIYGAIGGIHSKNFRNMCWWQQAENGEVIDPYKLLLTRPENTLEGDESDGINQGGAASNAYLRLQFEQLLTSEREPIERALLRYCELDTMAMVLIVQSWVN